MLSSDSCRGMVSDDENDQSATGDAFEVLHYIAAKRLAAGRLAVVDATNVQVECAQAAAGAGGEYHVLPVAIVFNLPDRICHERNAARPTATSARTWSASSGSSSAAAWTAFGARGSATSSCSTRRRQVAAATIERQPLWTDHGGEHGPFDIIGDVHGCYAELVDLLGRLAPGAAARRSGSR